MSDLNIPLTHEPITVLPRRFALERTSSPDEYILRIDNSTLEKFQTCARATEYYCIDARERGGSAALIFGGALHKALELHYLGRERDVCLAAASKCFLGTQSHPDEFRTPDFLTYVFDLYCDNYAHGDFVPDGVEKAFSLHMFDLNVDKVLAYRGEQVLVDGDSSPLYVKTIHVFWSGKIDLKLPNGICDHKTSTQEGPTFFSQFELSQPVIGYLWASRRIYSQPDLSNFILNAIFIRKPTKTGKGVTFTRYPYTYEDFHFNEWENDIRHNVMMFVHSLTSGSFPKSPAWCVGKFGMCPYHEVCTQPPSQRPHILHSDYYSPVTWSPLND